MVGGLSFAIFLLSNVLFVWGANPKGQVSGRGLWDILHIFCTGTLTKTHWAFQWFRLWVNFFISHPKTTCGIDCCSSGKLAAANKLFLAGSWRGVMHNRHLTSSQIDPRISPIPPKTSQSRWLTAHIDTVRVYPVRYKRYIWAVSQRDCEVFGWTLWELFWECDPRWNACFA